MTWLVARSLAPPCLIISPFIAPPPPSSPSPTLSTLQRLTPLTFTLRHPLSLVCAMNTRRRKRASRSPSPEPPEPSPEPKPKPKRKPNRSEASKERMREHDRQKKREDRREQAETKNANVYQLSARPLVDIEKWDDVKTERRHGKDGWVAKDAKKPPKPKALLDLTAQAIDDASAHASIITEKAVQDGRCYGLPFVRNFEEAPILGQDDTNVLVRSSIGRSLAHRLSPTSDRQADENKVDRDAGLPYLEALFAAKGGSCSRHGGQTVHAAHWYNDGRYYGWTRQHTDRGEAANDAVRWLYGFFHSHVPTLDRLLEEDFQSFLHQRDCVWPWFVKKMRKEQCSLLHPWWRLAAFIKGFTTGEHEDKEDASPTILICLHRPFVFYMAHSEGFFKIIMRPGQVLFFDSSELHSVHPLPGDTEAGERYAVSLSIRNHILLRKEFEKMRRRGMANPPQPWPKDAHFAKGRVQRKAAVYHLFPRGSSGGRGGAVGGESSGSRMGRGGGSKRQRGDE